MLPPCTTCYFGCASCLHVASTLFNIFVVYVNGIPKALSCRSKMFAGDTLIYRDIQREILRKRPKSNNNKAWIKFSEAILSILGDCWEKCMCSLLPARLMEGVPSQQGAPTTSRRTSRHYRPVWVWSQGKIQPFSGRGRGAGGGFWQKHIPAILNTKSPQTPRIVYFPATLCFQAHINFSKSPSQQKIAEEQIFWGTDPLGAPGFITVIL